jgi:hypothetical protein
MKMVNDNARGRGKLAINIWQELEMDNLIKVSQPY